MKSTLKSLSTSFRYTAQTIVLFALLSPPGASAETSPYRVEQQTVFDLKSVFASVQSVDVTQGRARIGGTLVELSVDEGDIVEAGQKLAPFLNYQPFLEWFELENHTLNTHEP